RNNSDLDTMSIDDLYNNFKIVEKEVKGTTSTNSSFQNMAFVSSSSPNSTNEVPTALELVLLALNLLVHEDLEQIHEDDIEEIDLKWQLALLSMRAKRNNKKDRLDQAENSSCSGSTKELRQFEAKADGVRSWGYGYAQSLTLERSCTIRVHHTFHVSNMKKCYADEPLVMPLERIHVDDKLQFVEEPVEITLMINSGYHWLRNNSDLDTMSIDDLYNNFKIVEKEVKGTTSTNSSFQNMAFVSSSSPNSTNEVPTALELVLLALNLVLLAH
nr:putative reverse transcriptase domain-containing protein [Tanacetum cinerariifolium]